MPRLAPFLALIAALSWAAPAHADLPVFQPDLHLIDRGGGDAVAQDILVPQLAAGFGAAVVSVPLALLLASALGSVPSDIILAAVPSLLLFLAIPPLAVVTAEWFVGRSNPDLSHPRPAIWWALGTHVLVTTVAALLGMWSRNYTRAAIFTLAEAIALPAVTTWSMQRGAAGSGSDTSFLPLLSSSF